MVAKDSNILYYPAKINYPGVDAILIHLRKGIQQISFIQITTIDENCFQAKLSKIQEKIEMFLHPTQNQNDDIFKKWMDVLAFDEFTSENTKFDFWIIFEGQDEWILKSDFSKYFNYLTFSARDGSNLIDFLNCQSKKQYVEYLEKMKLHQTKQVIE